MMKKDSKGSEKDSFGLVGVASTGAILAVMVMSLVSGSGELSGQLPMKRQLTRIFWLLLQTAFPHIAEKACWL